MPTEPRSVMSITWLPKDTSLSVERLRILCDITEVVVPPHFDPEIIIDKWGNTFAPEGYRILGPMASHEGMKRMLRRRGIVLI